MSDQGDDLLEQISKLLNDHGVSNWVIAFSDPDSCFDRVEIKGSKYWRAGLGMDLVDDVREARRRSRQEEEPE